MIEEVVTVTMIARFTVMWKESVVTFEKVVYVDSYHVEIEEHTFHREIAFLKGMWYL